jgi:hypothetical protein
VGVIAQHLVSPRESPGLNITCLIARHRDAHGSDNRCAEEIGTYARQALTDLGQDLAAQPELAHTA